MAANLAATVASEMIDLRAGEVVIEPPLSVHEAAIDINARANRYAGAIGFTRLRSAVAETFSAETGIA
ncbi:aspartate/methionine/tyrosine aminotransferase [Bradyrhizobium sp. JR4.1]|uniref:hypothetical protein n=1 Tax=Bradyrhizobium sp. JR4.1 TaxID=3156372 RepID=UPI003398334C